MAPKKTDEVTWRELQTILPKLTEEQCKDMLSAERKGKKRPQHLLRIHSRYNVLRAKRERTDLLK